jgi:hypothetical protein
MTEYKKLDDDEIAVVLDDCIRRSTGYYDSQISRERKKVVDYYNATLPRPAHDGNSKYVSMDVYDAVESMKSVLLETFSAGHKVVRFAPQNAEDTVMADVSSNYVDYVANRQNNLFDVMQTAIHDGLIARAGIAKVYWCNQDETTNEYVTQLTEDELDAMLAEPNIEIDELEQDATGLYTGTLAVTRDTSQVKIDSVAPENFLIEPQAKSLADVGFCAERLMLSMSDLREMGYDDKLLDEIGAGEEYSADTDPEVMARFEEIGADRGFNSNSYQDQVRLVTVYECYANLDCEGTGITKLYKITKAGNVILDKEVVLRKPYVAFVPLPVPHSFWGNNFGTKVVPTQNARTVLTRSILDHAMITNNPRYVVTKGSLTNPRELIDNRVGGIVNVTRPDAIMPMPQAPLNPFIFQTIKMLDDDKEQTSGVSRLSQGLNKDAISKQNSAAMVEQLATMSQQRQKIIARNFANNFLRPLYILVYQLVVENEDQEKIVDLAGQFVPIKPSQWADKRDVTVEMHLGYGEQEREGQKFLALHQLLSADPSIAMIYGPEQKHRMLTRIMEQSSIVNAADYLKDPATIEPPQPDPAQQLQLQMAQQQIEIQERQTKLGELKAQNDAEMASLKLELEKLKAERSFALQSDGLDLKEAQLEHKRYIDNSELDILKTTEDLRGIASPTG